MARRTDSNNPSDWLLIANQDLEGVRDLALREVAHGMCVSKLAEVLEKVIKAELIRTGWLLARTHDPVKLVDELRDRDAETADLIQSLSEELAERYFAGRYPGFDLDDEDWPRLRRQVDEVAAPGFSVSYRSGFVRLVLRPDPISSAGAAAYGKPVVAGHVPLSRCFAANAAASTRFVAPVFAKR